MPPLTCARAAPDLAAGSGLVLSAGATAAVESLWNGPVGTNSTPAALVIPSGSVGIRCGAGFTASPYVDLHGEWSELATAIRRVPHVSEPLGSCMVRHWSISMSAGTYGP